MTDRHEGRDGGQKHQRNVFGKAVDGLDDAFKHVGNAFTATNATLAAATGRVVHGISGGKLSEEEVATNMNNFGKRVERGVKGAAKAAESMFAPHVAREKEVDFLDGVDPSVQHHISASFSMHTERKAEDKELLEAIRRSLESFKKSEAPMRVAKQGYQHQASQPPVHGARLARFPAGDAMHFSHVDPKQARQIREDRADTLLVSEDGKYYFNEPARQLMLPDLRGYPSEMRAMVLHSLVCAPLQSRAEAGGIINSSPLCSRQYVLNTMGDGNCLSHACSLGVWGVHDRDKQLRRAIQGTMTGDGPAGRSIRKRFEQQLSNQGSPSEQWAHEWRLELDVFDDDRRYLGDVHCFVLANVLRRPVIIYGDEMALMGGLCGIYLPLLWRPPDCSSAPITVLYHESHFSLLCVLEGESPTGGWPLVQLTSAGGQPLPVRYTLPEEDANAMLHTYVAVQDVPCGGQAAIFKGHAADNTLVSLMAAVLRQQAKQ